MQAEYLFLDYLWDLMPNYFQIKQEQSDSAFNRPQLAIEALDDIFLNHLNHGNIFIEKPINTKQLYIGLTESGGKIWEQYFKVNWNNYLYFSIEEKDQQQNIELYSLNPDLFYLVFPKQHRVLSKNTQFLENYHITYWKNLKHCYRSTIIFTQDTDDDLWQTFHNADLPQWRESL